MVCSLSNPPFQCEAQVIVPAFPTIQKKAQHLVGFFGFLMRAYTSLKNTAVTHLPSDSEGCQFLSSAQSKRGLCKTCKSGPNAWPI